MIGLIVNIHIAQHYQIVNASVDSHQCSFVRISFPYL